MAFHAIEDIEDAFTTTREFLLPFDFRRWLRLAVVVFFVGSGSGFPTSGFNGSSSTGEPPDGEFSAALPDDIVVLVVAAVAVVAVLVLLWALVSSVMEFVFVESLRTGDVTIRQYWGRRWRQGVRLFGFRLALGVLGLVLFAAWLALLLVPLLLGGGISGAFLAGFLLGIPFVFLGGLVFGVVYLFTTVFVVPIMIKSDTTVLDGWRQLWPSIRAEWKQHGMFALVYFAFTMGAGLATAMVVGLVGLVLLIPFAGLGLVVFLTASFSTVGLVVIGLLVVVYLAVMATIWAFVQVPVMTYLRYYALFVLGDIDESFDLIPERRATVRGGE